MQYIWRFQILPGKSEELVAWLGENEATLADHTPEGWTYKGTWFTVRGFGSHDAEVRWDIDDYSALGAGWGDETHLRLVQEFWAFTDQSQGTQGALMKSASEVNTLPGS